MRGLDRRLFSRRSVVGAGFVGIAASALLQACASPPSPTAAPPNPTPAAGGAAPTKPAASPKPTAAATAPPTTAPSPNPAAAPKVAEKPAGAASAAALRALWVSQPALIKNLETYTKVKFGPKNGGAALAIEAAPPEEFPQKVLSSVAAGNPPDIIRNVNIEYFAQFASNGILLAIDDLVKRDNFKPYLDTFLPGTVEGFAFKGKLYGAPIGAHPSSLYLFYNKTALEKKGIKLTNLGWKWAEYVDAARAVSDPANKVFGAWIRANLEGYVVGVRSMGGDVLDETGTKSQISSEPAKRFWKLMDDMINVHKASPQPSDVADWKPPFAAQKIMMANDNGYRESFLREMVKDFQFDTFVIPNEGTGPRGALIADAATIAAKSKNADLAWEWNKGLLTKEEGILRVQNAQYIPLPTQEALLAKEALVSPQYEFYVRQWIEKPPRSAPIPANGRATELYSALQKGFEPAWLRTKPLDQVVSDVHTAIQAILSKSPA